jgi:protein-S-isoprenylcysteine O-methyltransferase Ste14
MSVTSGKAPAAGSTGTTPPKDNMLPRRGRRRYRIERVVMRIVATGGVIAIGVALGAILASSNVQGWIIGLVVAVVSVVLSGVLWSSRQV